MVEISTNHFHIIAKAGFLQLISVTILEIRKKLASNVEEVMVEMILEEWIMDSSNPRINSFLLNVTN